MGRIGNLPCKPAEWGSTMRRMPCALASILVAQALLLPDAQAQSAKSRVAIIAAEILLSMGASAAFNQLRYAACPNETAKDQLGATLLQALDCASLPSRELPAGAAPGGNAPAPKSGSIVPPAAAGTLPPPPATGGSAPPAAGGASIPPPTIADIPQPVIPGGNTPLGPTGHYSSPSTKSPRFSETLPAIDAAQGTWTTRDTASCANRYYTWTVSGTIGMSTFKDQFGQIDVERTVEVKDNVLITETIDSFHPFDRRTERPGTRWSYIFLDRNHVQVRNWTTGASFPLTRCSG
ncbi:MAG: hypothetical protein WDN25_22420 [Acetobacteraceae bacterium]